MLIPWVDRVGVTRHQWQPAQVRDGACSGVAKNGDKLAFKPTGDTRKLNIHKKTAVCIIEDADLTVVILLDLEAGQEDLVCVLIKFYVYQ